MIKKIILGLMLLSSLSFASEYKYYQCKYFDFCARKLNELKWEYEIINYTITYGGHYNWNMIIEVENKENSDVNSENIKLPINSK